LQYAATLADGWCSYFPGSGAEEYVEQCQEFDRLATEAGRDPSTMTKLMLFGVVLGDDDDEVEELIQNPVIRWDSAALVPGPQTWAQHGVENPIGPDFAYGRDLYPMEWSREDAMKVVDQVSPDMVRKMKFSGTPREVAKMIQPFIDAGATHVMIGDYGALVNSGDMGSAVSGARRIAECFDALRELNGQPTKGAAAQAG
ncbi:MAG TPA: LLM class flavin-dependent oxidoreductase, partial [Gemmatimonadaceae bacterium]